MQVYRKILVTMDCSNVDDSVVEHVASLALQNTAEVHLLHVVHSHTLDQDRVLHEKADTFLTPRCEKLRERGIEAQILIKSGEPDTEILKVIAGSDYDLVAMATHGHTFVGDVLYGSVSQTLKHRISVPLLLIGPRS